MMVYKYLKNLSVLLFVALLAVGCASTTSDSDGSSDADAADGAELSGTMDENTVVIEDVEDEADADIGTIFYFDFDKSELRSDVRQQLAEQAALLENKSGVVRLEGHADERGTREYNMALGERRAKAVANYLASMGVPGSQIETVSYGEEKPAALGHDEDAWALNRRVELIYID